MPDEEIKLTKKELDALERLAKAKNMDVEDVIESIAVQALMECPRDGVEQG